MGRITAQLLQASLELKSLALITLPTLQAVQTGPVRAVSDSGNGEVMVEDGMRCTVTNIYAVVCTEQHATMETYTQQTA